MKCRTLVGAAVAAKLSLVFGVAALAARPAEAEGLPAGYTELDCLISHGTEYIDTEVVPNSQTRLVVDFKYDELPSAGEVARNGWGSAGSLEAFMFGVSDAGKFVECVNSKTTYADCGTADCNRHVVDLASGRQSWDDEVKSTTTIGNTAESGQTMYLFAYHGEWYTTEGKMGAPCKMRIYSCQIYDGTTLVRNFVPCINAGSEPVLYDLVGEKEYANKGEGEFEYVSRGSTIVATLTDVETPVDGLPHGPVLTMTEPTSGYQVEWSTDGETFGPERPTFSSGDHTVYCHVTADGYLPLFLSATVKLTGTYTLAGADASGASSMSGTSTETAAAAGWTDPLGVTWKDHVPSAGNDYVANGPAPDYVLRTPTTADFTFGGDSLTLSGGVELKVKAPNNGIVTIPNLIVAGNAQIVCGDGNHLKKVAGAIDILEAGALKIDVSYDDTPTKARQFEIQSVLSGSGSLWTGVSIDGTSGSPYVRFTKSLADFTGKITVHAGDTMRYATRFNSNFPGNPAETLADGLTLEGNAALEFGASGTLGAARGISFGSGTREILVDSGKTVQINGLLTGSGGFKKTGAGKLVLARVSPEITGTVTVAAGTLQLCGLPEEVLPNATVTVSSGATVDEYGPAYGDDARVTATLNGVAVAVDGQMHGPELTVTEPAEGWKAVWSTDGVTYTPDRPTFDQPGSYPIFCRVSADGYMTRSLRATVKIGVIRRIVATEEEKGGVWSEATAAGDDAAAAIQGVIDACEDGDAIYVKPGTYALARELTFATTAAKGILLRSDDGEGNLAPETTVFDGGYPAQTHRVISVNSADVTLKGLTIRNGWMSGSNKNGGGVYVNANGFSVANCIFDTCGAYQGGGLYWVNKTVGDGISDCVFTNCTASYRGGGFYACPENCAVRQTTFTGCASTGNHGGGCFLERKGWTVVDSVFTNCTAQAQGGGMRVNSGASGAITNTTFVTCGAKAGGPALFSDGGVTMYKCRVVDSRELKNDTCWGAVKVTAAPTLIDSCYFSRNQGYRGTAAALPAGAVMTNCVFENQRRSVGYADRGVVTGSPRYTLRNCLFRNVESNCIVDENGDLENCTFTNLWINNMCGRSQNSFRNCLFVGSTNVIRTGNCMFENCSFVSNFGGPALGANNHSPMFTNCLFWANTPTTVDMPKTSGNFRGNMGLLVQKGDLDAVNRIKMANCVFQSNGEASTEAPDLRKADKTGATAALTAKAFEAWHDVIVSPRQGDAHPRDLSPLVDGGVALGWMEGATDLDGKPRIVGAAPDVGCFERQGDEIDPPIPYIRAVAKEGDKTGVWTNAFVGLPEALEAAYLGEPVYAKAGIYGVTEPVTMKKWGARVVGEGPGQTVFDGGYPARTNRIFYIDKDNVTLTGLTIRNGKVSSSENGGGVYVDAIGFTITNCVIDNCSAQNGGGLYWANKAVGGGVLDCVFTNCASGNNGAGLCLAPAKSVVRGTTIADCAATGNGACYIGGADWMITDCVFTNCTGNYGGGLRCSNVAPGAITNTAFLACGGKTSGQAFYSDTSAIVSKCRFEGSRQLSGSSSGTLRPGINSIVDNCYFSRNQGGTGSAASLGAGSVMTDCVIEDQPKTVSGSTDGVITKGAGSGRFTVRNCLFRNVSGGKIMDANVDLENCVFTNVYANNLFGNGQNRVRNCLFVGCTNTIRSGSCRYENCSFVTNVGGAFVTKSWSPTFTNCVFWGNTPSREGKCRGNSGIQIESDDKTPEARIKLANCVLQTLEEDDPDMSKYGDVRLADPTGATTNLTALALQKGPRFVAPANSDWRLKHNSPLRDKGLTLDWMTEEAVDLGGKPRRLDMKGKQTASALPDIGCYECDLPKPGILLQVR